MNRRSACELRNGWRCDDRRVERYARHAPLHKPAFTALQACCDHAAVAVAVVYQQNWPSKCGRYIACGQPVYFMEE